MGEMYIENLALHTRRGMEGVIRSGRHPGGRAYGYLPVAGKPGELQIVEAEAEVVRSIFDAYVAGKTPRAIAADLNSRSIPAPRAQNGMRQQSMATTRVATGFFSMNFMQA
jgi:site-specific DNA recombinase